MSVVIAVDLRDQFGPARDQDPRPTCMAFAASDAHAGVRQSWTPLSVEWAYYHALKRDGGPPSGGVTMTAMRITLRDDGQPAETGWPYIARQIDNTILWAPPEATPLFRRNSEECDALPQAIMARLDAGFSVLMIMSVSSQFDYGWDADFVVAGNEPLDPTRRHAVVVVGHGTRAGRTLFLVRNSWGEEWGDRGYVWLDLDYLRPRLLRASVLTEEI